MTAFLAKGKKTKYEIPEQEEIVPLKAREGNVGKWQVTQIVSKEQDQEEGDDGVKEESPDPEEDDETATSVPRGSRGEGKRDRPETPDREDLVRFKVEEKVFPTDVKDEDEEVRVPGVGFKKRKVGNKSSRVVGAL